jgi:hypothetical protein
MMPEIKRCRHQENVHAIWRPNPSNDPFKEKVMAFKCLDCREVHLVA